MIKIRHATMSLSAMGALAVAAHAQQQQPSSPNTPSQAPSQSSSGVSSTTTTTTSRPSAPPSPDLNTDTNSQPDMTGSSGHPDTDVRIKGKGGLASAMANFSVRTGLEIRPNSIGQVVVQTVRPDTASARAGIEPGDIITNLNGTEITTIDSLQKLISKQPSQGAYFASFRRGEKDFRVPLGRQLSLMGMTLFPDRADRPTVKAVELSSPADRAGFQVGDVITGIDRQDTGTLAKLLDFGVPFMRNLSQGQGIRFRVVRDGKERQFSVTRPADADLPILTPDQERHLRRVANGDDERREDHRRPRMRTTKTTRTTAGVNSMQNQSQQQPNQAGYGGVGGFGGGIVDGGFGDGGLGTGIGTTGATGMNGSSNANAAVAELRGTTSMSQGQQTGNSANSAGQNSGQSGQNSRGGFGVVGFVQIQSNVGLNGQNNNTNGNQQVPGANPVTGNTSTNNVNPNARSSDPFAQQGITAPNANNPNNSTGNFGASGFGGTSSFGGGALNTNGTNGLNTGLPGVSVSSNGINGTGTNGTGTNNTMNNGTNNNNTNNNNTNNTNNGNNNGATQSFVSAQISRVPAGTYTLTVNQFGECGDSAGAAPGPSVFTLGTITVNAGGQGSLSQTINFAPQAFIGRTVSLTSAPNASIGGGVPGHQAQTLNPTSQGNSSVVGCGKFRATGQGNNGQGNGFGGGNGFNGGNQGGLGVNVGPNGGTTGTGTGTNTGNNGQNTMPNNGTGTGTQNPTPAPGSVTPPGGLPRPLFP